MRESIASVLNRRLADGFRVVSIDRAEYWTDDLTMTACDVAVTVAPASPHGETPAFRFSRSRDSGFAG